SRSGRLVLRLDLNRVSTCCARNQLGGFFSVQAQLRIEFSNGLAVGAKHTDDDVDSTLVDNDARVLILKKIELVKVYFTAGQVTLDGNARLRHLDLLLTLRHAGKTGHQNPEREDKSARAGCHASSSAHILSSRVGRRPVAAPEAGFQTSVVGRH